MRPTIRHILTITLAFAALYAGGTNGPSASEKQQMIDSIRADLPMARTPAERIRMLTDIFDLSNDTSLKDSIGSVIYDLALQTGDSDAGLDILRHLGNLHVKEDSLLAVDISRAQKFRPTPNRDITVTFLRMLRNHNGLRYADETTRIHRLQQLLEISNANPPSDIYEKIVLLHALCLYIGNTSQGEMLIHYMDKLEELITSLPKESIPLRSAFYTQAAIIYRQNDDYEKGLQIDRQRLECIRLLEQGNAKAGRKYRNYDAHYYVIYTHMLSNYPLLSDEEVEEIYSKIHSLINTNDLAANTEAQSGRAEIYYSMHHKRYGEALRLIYRYKDSSYNRPYLNILYKLMVECGRQTGNKEALLEGLEGYSNILEKTLKTRLQEKTQELQIIYDIHELKEQNLKQEHQADKTRTLMLMTGTAILFIVLVIMVFMYHRMRRLASNLKQSNNDLQTEKANIQKTQSALVKARDEAQAANRTRSDFIRNMSNEVEGPLHVINEYTNLLIDCVDTGDKPYLRDFAEKIQFNSELLMNLFSDVLTLAQADNRTLAVHPKKTDIRTVCDNAITVIRRHVKKNVRIELAPDMPSVQIDTDPQRLSQILYQLLSNAAKFTEEGSIILSYQALPAVNSVKISVTDTGIGINEKNKETIFQRFSKLDSTSQGVGLGLPLALKLAQLLGGHIELDTTYSQGARLILTIPMTIAHTA
ncbi:MAG: hypothetical protein C7K11_00595 [Candidatus Amulumruptor caecigallinarius]|nr:MAG: hypothetical protein C7K11_00595 [Candidatus Amulumruptor caecigallinarius]